MATATRDQGKTSFVREFLSDHPHGNVKAVNEAWATAGMNGTIGPTLINKLRSQMGLSGNLRAKSKTRTAAKGKAVFSMPKTAIVTPGKTMFVREFLSDDPRGNVKVINEVWKSAGFEGTISPTLVNKTRASMGLTRKLSGKTDKTSTSTTGKTTSTGKKLGRPRREPTAAVNGKLRGRKSNRSLALNELEADIDRLIFKVMGVGDLTEIEESLRRARRLLYGTTIGR